MRLRHLLNDRAVNSLLLVTVLALALTGVAGLFANAAGQRAVFYAHRIGGAALLVLLIPKAGIIARALRRRAGRRRAARRAPGARGRLDLLASLLLLGATLVLIGAVLGWSLARGPWRGEWGLPLIVVHWYLALGILPLLAWHVKRRWRRPRAADFAGRRRVLAPGGAALVAPGASRALDAGAHAAPSPGGRP